MMQLCLNWYQMLLKLQGGNSTGSGDGSLIVAIIVIVISKLLKRYSKAKRTRAPAYSRALQRIKGGFPKGGQEKLRSDFQSTRRRQSSYNDLPDIMLKLLKFT